jgi:hypothetical protein
LPPTVTIPGAEQRLLSGGLSAAFCPNSIASSSAAMYWARLPPRESKAPHFTSASTTFFDPPQVDPFGEIVEEAKGFPCGPRYGVEGRCRPLTAPRPKRIDCRGR